MSNREPSFLRRIYPALALTGVGFGLVNVLDRPAPATSLAAGSLASTDGSATTVVAGADAAAATTVPATPNSVAAQGQAATPVTQAPAATAAPAAPAATAAPVTTPAPAPAATAAPVTAAPVTTPAPAPAANDCGAITKTGSAATIVHRREYGTLQVTAKFTSAKVLCAANASYSVYESRSNRYNDYAIPILSDQAVSAKSANIQGVSGATATSNAYANSLQSAIDQL